MPHKLTAMKARAFILSALLLLPATATAGAQVVNPAPAPAMVKVTEANLPVALTDEELDEVTGENPFIAVGVVLVGRAIQAAAPVIVREAAKALAGGCFYDAVVNRTNCVNRVLNP